jgi:cysteine-rich repeat protein
VVACQCGRLARDEDDRSGHLAHVMWDGVINSAWSPRYRHRMRRFVPVAMILGVLGLAPAGRAQVVAVCGNGALEVPELCDDGNLADGDGCDSNCTPTGCGNGVVTGGEECDDGNTVSGDCCSALCLDENLPPDCRGAAASIDELWPPNHALVSVGIVGVTDPDGDPLIVSVIAIGQDEPIDSTGDGATCPDGIGVGLDRVSLRSERSGQGDGRFYHVAFQAVDRCDAVCTGEVTVTVRHDQSPKKTPGDGGPLFDSTLGAPPCEGDACDPTDCVPDPDDVDACDGVNLPASVTAKLEKAKEVLGRGDGRRSGHAAAKLLRKAAKRSARAARSGDLPAEGAEALAEALEGGRNCAICSAE